MSKIVEHIKNERTDEEVPAKISISSIAGLREVDTLEDGSLFEISAITKIDKNDPVNDKYSSRSVSWKTIMSKLQGTSFINFNQLYRELRFGDVSLSDIEDDTQTTVYRYLTETSGDYKWAGTGAWALPNKHNENEPCVWGDVWTLTNGEALLSQWLDDVDRRLANMEHTRLAFSPNMLFNTVLSTYQTDSGELNTPKNDHGQVVVPNETISQQYANPRSGIHSNGFVLAFWKQNKVSSEFVCPATGMLTLYGWLDSSNVQNIKYLPSAWCALEGKIGGNWEIMQIQSVVPAKQFSYVSFCVPVVKDLTVRMELGFVPGEASGRYDRSKIPESLANTQPNAFLGGVYSPLA